METKPFGLQSPESIAKEYGGNKQKIGQAAQLGLLDPTAAVLAGMFIDRMRSAQMQEMQPKPTIAQQVFAPPAPPAPPAAPAGLPPLPPRPPVGGPPPSAPPPPVMNAPQGMAEGGVASLPVPDSMYDEPVDAESFAGGGIVAFADGGMYAGYSDVDPETGLPVAAPATSLADIVPPAPAPAVDPRVAYVQQYSDLMKANLGPDSDKYTRMRAAELEKEMSPEAEKAQRKRDMWMALAQIGAGMASSRSPSFLGAIGEATGAALPGIQRAQEARQAMRRDAIKELASNEQVARSERIQTVAAALAQQEAEAKTQLERDRYEADKRNAADRLGVDKNQLEEQIRHNRVEEEIQQRQADAQMAAAGRERTPAFNLNAEYIQSKIRTALIENDKLPYAKLPDGRLNPAVFDAKGNLLPGKQYRKTPTAVRDDVVTSFVESRPKTQQQGAQPYQPGVSPDYSVGAAYPD